MGLVVSVFRSSFPDATNNGISCRYDHLFLANVEGPTQDSQYPIALLIRGNGKGYAKIVPGERQQDGSFKPKAGWAMMGGNYASTSDSRFHFAVEMITGSPSFGAVPIHDRYE